MEEELVLPRAVASLSQLGNKRRDTKQEEVCAETPESVSRVAEVSYHALCFLMESYGLS